MVVVIEANNGDVKKLESFDSSVCRICDTLSVIVVNKALRGILRSQK